MDAARIRQQADAVEEGISALCATLRLVIAEGEFLAGTTPDADLRGSVL